LRCHQSHRRQRILGAQSRNATGIWAEAVIGTGPRIQTAIGHRVYLVFWPLRWPAHHPGSSNVDLSTTPGSIFWLCTLLVLGEHLVLVGSRMQSQRRRMVNGKITSPYWFG
jgi:hypothetical protein